MMWRCVKYFATNSVICAELLSKSSNALWRDMEEGRCRCLMRLGRQQEALDCVSRLVGSGVVIVAKYLNPSTVDIFTRSWNFAD